MRGFILLLGVAILLAFAGRVMFPDGVRVDSGTTHVFERGGENETVVHCAEGATCFVKPYDRNNGVIVPFGFVVLLIAIGAFVLWMRRIDEHG